MKRALAVALAALLVLSTASLGLAGSWDPRITDGFDDDTLGAAPDDWNVTNGNPTTNEVNDSWSDDGGQSYYINEEASGQVEVIHDTQPWGSNSTAPVEFTFKNPDSPTGDGSGQTVQMALVNSNDSLVLVGTFGNNLSYWTNGSWTTIENGDWGDVWYVKIHNINLSANKYDVDYSKNGGTIKTAEDLNFSHNQTNGYSKTRLGVNGAGHFDSISAGEASTSSSGVSQTIGYDDHDPRHDWNQDDVRFILYEGVEGSVVTIEDDKVTTDREWSLEDSQDENWNHRAKFTGLSNDEVYKVTLVNKDEGATWEVIGWTPEDKPDPWIVCIGVDGCEAPPSTATPSPTETPPGTVITDCTSPLCTITSSPPGGETWTEVNYTITGPNGTSYNYSSELPDGTSWYGSNFTDIGLPIENPNDWKVDYSFRNASGSWYNGTLGLSDTATLGESSVFGGGGPMQQGGDGSTPVSLIVLVLAAITGYYYRKPGRRQELTRQLQAAGGRVTDLAGRLER